MDNSTLSTYPTTVFVSNVTNGTTTNPPRDISTIVQVCFSIILCIVMFGVGCAGDFAKVISHFKHPAGICTGIFNQFIIMPVLALAFVSVTQIPQDEAMAVLIQGTAPGGMMSNIITYWIHGDINLSISMTAVSTVIALGSMPLWLFIFTLILQIEESLQIPFNSLGIALAIMVLPVIFGALLRRYKPKEAEIITKVFTIFGTIAIVVTLIVSGIVSELSFYLSWRQWLICFLTPILGMVLGYLVALLPFLRLTEPSRRTIAIETGMQNCQISQSVLVISYASNIAIYEKIRLFPLLNSFFQILYGVIMAIIIRKCSVFSVKYVLPTSTIEESKDLDEEQTCSKDN
ncbi:ileal sodium/bile acid cotransporter-like [Styela clava]